MNQLLYRKSCNLEKQLEERNRRLEEKIELQNRKIEQLLYKLYKK